MKIFILLICTVAIFSGCATTTKTHHHDWYISLTPKKGNEYEFKAHFREAEEKRKEGVSGYKENSSTTLAPTLTLTPNKPAEFTRRPEDIVSIDGKTRSDTAKAFLEEKDNKVIVTYSVSIRENNVIHATEGIIEVNK
ncbi:hypothetical protein ACFLS1_04655 [Verrucomicrobiota bacterium]